MSNYILELKTIQSSALRTLIDTLQGMLSDVNFVFYPYHVNDDSNSDSEFNSDTSDSDSDSESNSECENDFKPNSTNKYDDDDSEKVNDNKKIGGLRVMAVNKNSTILVHV